MTVPDQIERTVEVAHPVQQVWAALTTIEGLGGWFGTCAEVDLRPGGRAIVWWDKQPTTLWIQVVEPPHRFAYTWAIEGLAPDDPRRTHVEFTLTPTAGGTCLHVVESGFAQLPPSLSEARKLNTIGWSTELTELTEYLDAAI